MITNLYLTDQISMLFNSRITVSLASMFFFISCYHEENFKFYDASSDRQCLLWRVIIEHMLTGHLHNYLFLAVSYSILCWTTHYIYVTWQDVVHISVRWYGSYENFGFLLYIVVALLQLYSDHAALKVYIIYPIVYDTTYCRNTWVLWIYTAWNTISEN